VHADRRQSDLERLADSARPVRSTLKPGLNRAPGEAGSILALQRLAGNAAVAALLQRDTHGAATAPASSPTKAAAAPKPGDSMHRFVLDGLNSFRIGGKKAPGGRAVVLVPAALASMSEGEVAVQIYLHGIWGENPKDREGVLKEDGESEIPAQVEAFLQARSSARMIVIMPIGHTYQSNPDEPDPKKKLFSVTFGGFAADPLAKEVVSRLIADQQLPAKTTPGAVILSAHSGGGIDLGSMLNDPKRMPKRLAGVLAFENIHKDLSTYQNFVRGKLKDDLAGLRKYAAAPGSSEADAEAAFNRQEKFLREEGFRFMGFAGFGGYKKRFADLRDDRDKWFDENDRDLHKVAGAHYADIRSQLLANYAITSDVSESTHYNVMATSGRNLETALKTLPPGVGR